MKKLKLIIVFVVILNVTLLFIIKNNNVNEPLLESENNTNISDYSGLAIMLQNETGDYELSTSDTWPTKEEGYVFNPTLSKCENGGELTWNDGRVTLKTSGSDKCYVYFDKAKGLIKNASTVNDYKSFFDGIHLNIDVEKNTDESLEMQYQIDGDKLWYHNSKNDIKSSKIYDLSIYSLNAKKLTVGQEYQVNIRLVDTNGNIVDATSVKSVAIAGDSKDNAVCLNLADYHDVMYAQDLMYDVIYQFSCVLAEMNISNKIEIEIDNVYFEGEKVKVSGYSNTFNTFDKSQINELVRNSGDLVEVFHSSLGLPITMGPIANQLYEMPVQLNIPIDDYSGNIEEYPIYDEVVTYCQNIGLCNDNLTAAPISGTFYINFPCGTMNIQIN